MTPDTHWARWQDGHFIIYSAKFATMNALIGFLIENCCGGKPCGPALRPV